MSEQTSQEPTMEEILASIRRIISEDDAPAGEGAAAEAAEEAGAASAAAFESEPVSEPEPMAPAMEPEPPADEDDALELTEKVETHGDLDIVPTAPSAPPPRDIEPLVSDPVASVAAAAFGQLSSAILMPHSDRTLEDVVRELLRPMLQQWLDDNLPGIVQQAVAAEVERIARGRVR